MKSLYGFIYRFYYSELFPETQSIVADTDLKQQTLWIKLVVLQNSWEFLINKWTLTEAFYHSIFIQQMIAAEVCTLLDRNLYSVV